MASDNPLSLRRLLRLHEVAFLFLVTVTALLSGLSAYLWQQTAAESVRLNNSIYLAEQIRGELFIQIQEAIKARVLEDFEALGVYMEFSRNIDRHFNQLRQAADAREEAAAIQRLQGSYRRIQREMNKIFGDPYAANYVVRIKLLEPEFSQAMVEDFEGSYREFKGYFNAKLQAIERRIRFWTRYAPILIPVIFLLSVIIVFYTSYIVRNRFVNQVATITVGASAISRGDLKHRIPERGVKEIGVIAQSINQMAADLETSRNALIQQERQAALGALVPVVAHNIRNPLASIRAAAQVLDKVEDQAELRESRQAIIDTIDRLGRWVNALVSYLHPLKPALRRMPVTELLDAAVKLLQPRLAGKGLEVIQDHRGCKARVAVDPDLMEQAIYGLLANAIDASPPQGRITLGLREEADELRITIADQGPGLPFEPRPGDLEPGPSTKKRGTGLGIPIAYKICQSHGWGIRFAKRRPHGTIVTLTAPMGPAAPADEREKP